MTACRTRSLLAALAVCSVLAACGSSESTSGSTTSAPATTSSSGSAATVATTGSAPTGSSPSTMAGRPLGRGLPGGATAAPAPTKADVAYASTSSAQVLDLWVPADATGPVPLVINIHGGAFKSGDKSMETGNVQALLDEGYAVASVNYRLSGEATFPAAVQDVKAAVRYLRANAASLGLDPDRFAAWGGSAGGNLAAMLGVTGDQAAELDDPALGNPGVSSEVQAVVDWFGPTDFLTMDSQLSSSRCASPDTHDPASSPESAYVGAAIQTVPDRSNAASPLTYVDTATSLPVFVIAHGDSDCQIPPAQSTTFAEALKAEGATVTLTILPGAVHADPQFASTQTAPAIAALDQAFGRG